MLNENIFCQKLSRTGAKNENLNSHKHPNFGSIKRENKILLIPIVNPMEQHHHHIQRIAD